MPPTAPKPRLLLADHAPTRLGMRLALADTVEICAEAGDAAEAISAVEQSHPDVCLVGADIPGGGVVAVHGIRAVAPNTAVVLVAAEPAAGDMLAAVRAGAVGYLPGTIEAEPLRRVVTAVLAGEAALPRAMVLELACELRNTTRASAHGLTAREAQVFEMVSRGESTARIAERLAISPVTVRRHISTLVQKVGVDDRAALAASGFAAANR